MLVVVVVFALAAVAKSAVAVQEGQSNIVDALADAEAALAKEHAERAEAEKVGNKLADVLSQTTKELEEKSHEVKDEEQKETGLVEQQTLSLDHCQMMLTDATKAATDEQSLRQNSENKVADLVAQVQASISQAEMAAKALEKTEKELAKSKKEKATQKQDFVEMHAQFVKLNEKYLALQSRMGESDQAHLLDTADLNKKVATLTQSNAACMKDMTSLQNEYKKQQKVFVMSSKVMKEQTLEVKALQSKLKDQTITSAKLGEENKKKDEEEHGLALELAAEKKQEQTAETAVLAERKAFLGVRKMESDKMEKLKSASKKEREEMEKSLASRQSELVKLLAEAKVHQADVKKMEAHGSKLLGELSQAHQQVRALTEDNTNLQKTVTLNNGDLVMAEAKLDRDAQALSSTHDKLHRAETEAARVKDAKSKEDVELKQEVEKLAETREELSKTKKLAETRKELSDKKLGMTEKARNKLADLLHTTKEELSKAASHSKVLESKIASHKKELEKFQTMYEISNAASKKKDEEIQDLNQEEVHLKKVTLSHEKAMAAEAKELSDEVEGDKKKMKSQEAALAKLANEDREHQELVKSLVEKEKDLKGTLLDLTAAEKLTKSNLDKEEKRVRDTDLELKTIKSLLEAKKEQSAKLQAKVLTLTEEQKSIYTKLDQEFKQVALQSDELKQKKEEVKGKDEEIEILSTNVEKVSKMLEQKVKEKKLAQETQQAEALRQTEFDAHMDKLKRTLKVADKIKAAKRSARQHHKAEQKFSHSKAKAALASNDGGELEVETPQEANLNQALADSEDSSEAADKADLAEFEASEPKIGSLSPFGHS